MPPARAALMDSMVAVQNWRCIVQELGLTAKRFETTEGVSQLRGV